MRRTYRGDTPTALILKATRRRRIGYPSSYVQPKTAARRRELADMTPPPSTERKLVIDTEALTKR